MEQTAFLQVCEIVEKNKWNCNETDIRFWVSKLARQVNDVFQLNEVIHFVTEEQINTHTIVLNPDRAMMASLFKNKISPLHHQLQDPSVTFEKDLKNTQCQRCKKFNTLSIQSQKRAIDEPGRNDYQCLDCKHRWFTN
jgi:DNA-directed RNA polymerase subunit M/transcription elongation factor TFIIS